MPSFIINNASLAPQWSYVIDPSAWWCYTSMPTGTPADPSGNRRQLITYIAMAMGGQNGTKTYSVFAANSDGGDRKTSSNYTVPYSATTSLQPPRLINGYKKTSAGQTVRVGFNQVTSPILVGRGPKAGINIVSENPSGFGWPGYSLYGRIYYATLPSAPGRPSLYGYQDEPGVVYPYWTAPANTGDSSITSYRLQYSKNSNFSGATTVTASSGAPISGLDQGSRYYFRVAAINGVASIWGTTSAWSSSNSIITPLPAAKVATPVFTPPESAYVGSASVAISTTTPGATIYYTTNGATPTTGSSVYSSPLNITSTTTVKALAVAGGYTNSDIPTAVFTIVDASVSNGSTWDDLVAIRRSDGTNWIDLGVQISDGADWDDPA